MASLSTPLEAERLAVIRAALQEMQNAISLPQLVALLTIAIEPGISVNDLGEKIGFPQQTASRYASILLGRYESVTGTGPTHALISQSVSEDDPRKRALFLTEQGEEMVQRLLR